MMDIIAPLVLIVVGVLIANRTIRQPTGSNEFPDCLLCGEQTMYRDRETLEPICLDCNEEWVNE